MSFAIINFHPRIAWGHDSVYSNFHKRLIKVYSAPSSFPGVERQHNVEKRVHYFRHNCTGGSKIEKQIAVVHYSQLASIKLDEKRQSFKHYIEDMCELNKFNAKRLQTFPTFPTLSNELKFASQFLDCEALIEKVEDDVEDE